MPFIQEKCPKCNKTARVKTTHKIESGRVVNVLECGHLWIQDQIAHKSLENYRSLKGDKLRPFQIEGVNFLESANGTALVGDEQGLGKTVQALAFLYTHQELFPAVAVVKSSLRIQWQHQFMFWCSEDFDDGMKFAQIIGDKKDELLPGMPMYIVSFDLLRRFNGPKGDRGHYDNKFEQMMIKRGVKTLIIDECQNIKNPDSQRSVEVRRLAKIVDHVIALSGTPIKNHAGEYFSILNMLHPEMFPNYAQFLRYECKSEWTGFSYKTQGLKDPENFTQKTKHFIIRRERKDVAPELPTVDRQFQLCDLADEVEQAYKDTFIQFRDAFNNDTGDKFADNSNTLAYLSRMRHLVGYSKIDPTIEYVMEFLGGTSDQRICIFAHHKDVAEVLQTKLTQLLATVGEEAPWNLVGMNPEAREIKKNDWLQSKSRVLILSALASGEGLDGLQTVCTHMIMLERQWNPANEEQVEGRLARMGSMQQAGSILAMYFVAVGTVDEFFSEIVERKREIVTKTMGGEAVEWTESSIMKELAEVLAMSGGKKWGI